MANLSSSVQSAVDAAARSDHQAFGSAVKNLADSGWEDVQMEIAEAFVQEVEGIVGSSPTVNELVLVAQGWACHRELLLDIVLSDQDTSAEVLDEHSRDESLAPTLLDLIARHPNASGEVLVRIAAHKNVSRHVLLEVVANPNSPVVLVEDILLHAGSHYGVSDQDAISIYLCALRRSDLPSSALIWLARNCSHPHVLHAVAQHSSTPDSDAVFAALSTESLLSREAAG